MTEKEQYEVKKFLEAKGLSRDAVEGAMRSIEFHENTKEIKDSKEVSRAREYINFKPNPGKATLTQVGETQTYLGGDNHGLPIYKEDVDMIKKSTPLAKKLVEIQKTKPQEPVDEKPLSEMTPQEKADYWNAKEENEKQTLRTLRDTIDEVYEIDPEELNMGPDTTENIHEISEEERMNLEAGWYKLPDNVKRVPGIVKQAIQKSRGIKKNENEETPDVMWYFDPESELEYGTEGLQGKSKQCNKNASSPRSDIDDLMYPSKEAVDKAMEECNKNVSCPQDYSSILRQMDNTHTRKNSDYGDAAYKGYKKYGDYYFLVQLHNKLTRLENLTINNKKPQVEDESIDDSLLDMANYAVMYLESRHRND